MRRTILTGVFILLCFLLQTSVLPWFSFGGIVPNLLIILTAALGFLHGETAGLLTGFACGLLVDLFAANTLGTGSGDMLGFYALLYMVAGFLNGKCSRMFFPDDLKLPLFLITVSDLGLNLILYVVMFLFRAKLNIQYYFLHIILPEAVYTFLVAFIFYPLLRLVYRKLKKRENRSAD